MSHATWFALATSLYAMSSVLGCSSDEGDEGNEPNAGTAGSAGSGGSAGTAGSTGKGGSGGSAGAQGGSAGSGGKGGTAGTNATGGAGTGGMNGGAGSGGTSGSAGNGAGMSGTAGMAGSAGNAGAGDAGADGEGGSGGGGGDGDMNVFVTSDTSPDADLGGLDGADARCQALAEAVGHGDKTWVAYLSTEDPAVNARDRIGEGPYYNALGGLIAEDKDALHARTGDAELFLDENGERINGQWEGSPDPNEHDILTGTEPDGTVAAGLTCGDWTMTTGESRVGHSDGLGPNMNPDEPYSFWNGSHEGQCGDTAPGGGSGRIYCFVAP